MVQRNINSITSRALDYLRNSKRVKVEQLTNNPGYRTQPRQIKKVHNYCGHTRGELERCAKPPLGWIMGKFGRPWQRTFPVDPSYHKGIHLRREYPPLSLLELQRMIDLGWLNTEEPIDLSSICSTKLYICQPRLQHFGVQLTDEGADIFAARVNIEVQWASELAIAAIERNGGVITTAYYDLVALEAAVNPTKFFESGQPIPKRAFPPHDATEYYMDATTRGYLCDPRKLVDARLELAQKYGYVLPDISKDHNYEMLKMRKHPLQCFYGLEPGWIINLKDRLVIKPTDEEYISYYNTNPTNVADFNALSISDLQSRR